MGLASVDINRLDLQALCVPRRGLVAQARSETVADLADLAADRIAPEPFFAETHVTAGMEDLLKHLFRRLTGNGEQGVFRLKQAMGGGKTHNLIAAGLLAKHPDLRRSILGGMGVETDGRPIRLAAFSGRETDLQEFLWVHLARQLGRADLFEGAASDPPGPATWAKVVGSEPTLILLDELPPFFVALAGRIAGPGTTEADRLALALANLMVAILNNRLPNCCLVISDLTGAWEAGSVRIQTAIDNATAETSRAAMDIVPVRMDGNELYAILRTRLFERCPTRAEVGPIADAYNACYETAVQQGAMPTLYQRWAYDVLDTYPFHPGLQELFARFRENPGFQQTREMLRLARLMVLDLWKGEGSGALLIHPHHMDFGNAEVESLINGINPSLANARAKDVAKRGGATAEELARTSGDGAVADAAKLLYLSSLAVQHNALRGLTAEEAAAYLAAPGRDVSRVNEAMLSGLEDQCWYLHRRTDGRWCFRDAKNVNSAIRDRAETMNPDARRKEVEDRLRNIFEPGRQPGSGRLAYQKLLVFPSPQDIQEALGQDATLLVIGQPHPLGLNPVLRQLWEDATFKNRLMFLCGVETFTNIADHAAYVRAADDQVKEYRQAQLSPEQPEMRQATKALDRWQNSFRSALRETFTRLYYPGLDGTLADRNLRLEFAANEFVGEAAILETLRDEQKYRDDLDSDGLRQEFEQFVFNTQDARWRDLVEAAARMPEWYLLPPGGLESMRAAAERKDLWRDDGGGYIRRGPFPKEPTSVSVREIARDDDTGEATLTVTGKFADRVHYEVGGTAPTTASPVVGGTLQTREMEVIFLAVDSTGEHAQGEPHRWKNRVTLKHGLKYRDGAHRVTLKAAPRGTIRYTLDGSDPKRGGICDGEVMVPAGTEILLAVAEAAGEWSDVRRVPIPRADDDGPGIDPTRPAEWRHALRCPDRHRSFEVLGILKRFEARLCGAQLTADKPGSSEDWVTLSFGNGVQKPAADIEAQALALAALLGVEAQPGLALQARRMAFPSGQALIEAARELGEPLNPEFVKQS